MRRFSVLLVVLLIGGALMPIRFVPSTDAPTHLGRFRDTVVGEGKFSVGVPFANQAILALYPNARMVVQAAFGADLSADPSSWPWVDITTSVRQNDGNIVNITPMGRSDETSKAQPAGCTFVLDNRSGDFTAYHPSSRYYPYVRRNTPIRVLVNLTGDPLDTSTRFEGYANGWTPGWETTNSEEIAVVAVDASGVTRRLGQGKSPLKSALLRSIDAGPAPVGYWPMSDGSEATQAASGLTGGPPLRTAGTAPTFAAIDGPPGTNIKYPQFMVDSTLVGSLEAPVDYVDSGEWTVEGWFFAEETSGGTGLAEPYHWELAGSAYARLVLQIQGGTVNPYISMYFLDETGGIAEGPYARFIQPFDGAWHYIRFTAVQNSATSATLSVFIDGVAGTTATFNTDIGRIANHVVMPVDPLLATNADVASLSLAESAVYDVEVTDDRYEAGYGYIGETATERLVRLCNEAGVPIDITGTSDTTMGAQSVDTLLNLLRECETADAGVLYDGLTAGLGYITRSAIYNQTAAVTVAAGSAKLGVPFGPTDNDQRNRNQVTARRKNGSSATYEDTDGPLGTAAIGLYDSTIPGDLNIESDDDLLQHAAWAVHLGTVEGFRYPSLSFDFRATPELAEDWLAVLPLNLFDVTDLDAVFAQHPPGDLSLLGEGWSEQISPFIWKATVNCSPGTPWAVGVLDTAGWLDCGASVLSGDHNATTTTLNLAISDVCVWTHASGDYNIIVGGEGMTVTAVGAASGSGSSWTQALTVTRSVNGIVKTHAAGAEVHVAEPIVLAL